MLSSVEPRVKEQDPARLRDANGPEVFTKGCNPAPFLCLGVVP